MVVIIIGYQKDGHVLIKLKVQDLGDIVVWGKNSHRGWPFLKSVGDTRNWTCWNCMGSQ